MGQHQEPDGHHRRVFLELVRTNLHFYHILTHNLFELDVCQLDTQLRF